MSVSLISSDQVAKVPTPVGFFNLPRELQLQIFSYLTHDELCRTVALVCQDWRRLCKDPSLWKCMIISVRREDETHHLAYVLHQSSMLTRLKIDSSFSVEKFAVTSHAYPMLKYLDLGFCRQVDSGILYHFVTNCPLIEELNVEGCDKVEKKAVSFIVNLSCLRVLNLSHCIFVDNECIQLISEKCCRLEDLDVDGITRITDQSVCDLGENLNATLLRLMLDGEELTDLAFAKIGLCTKLEHLSISFGELLTDETFVYLKTLTRLRSLKLKRTSLMTTIAISTFFDGPHVQNLVKLELDSINIDDEGVYKITQSCKLLKTLSLPWCWEVTEVGLEHIVKYCYNLFYLDLLGLYHLTGICLLNVPKNLSNLEYLNLEQCNEIVDSVLVDLAVRVPKLKVFNYYGELVVPESSADECDDATSIMV